MNLRPANILLDADGTPKMADFGLFPSQMLPHLGTPIPLCVSVPWSSVRRSCSGCQGQWCGGTVTVWPFLNTVFTYIICLNVVSSFPWPAGWVLGIQ